MRERQKAFDEIIIEICGWGSMEFRYGCHAGDITEGEGIAICPMDENGKREAGGVFAKSEAARLRDYLDRILERYGY